MSNAIDSRLIVRVTRVVLSTTTNQKLVLVRVSSFQFSFFFVIGREEKNGSFFVCVRSCSTLRYATTMRPLKFESSK
jgi:hypothetical protein